MYDLYGVVQHSGSLRGGHYIAYVKYSLNECEFKDKPVDVADGGETGETGYWSTANGADDNYGYVSEPYEMAEPVVDKDHVWCYTSDSYVTFANEKDVDKSQAYLLLYVEHKY